jgi:hypothetical protein
MEKTHPWKGKKMTPQPFTMHRLVSFPSDKSRAVVLLFVVSCCLPESSVLMKKGVGILEGDLAWRRWITDAPPLEKSSFTWLWWIQGAISVTLTAVRVNKITTKGPLQ